MPQTMHKNHTPRCGYWPLIVPVLILLTTPGALAQSIAVTSPSPSQVITGYSTFTFTSTLTSAPNTERVCYTIDAYAAVQPDNGSLPMTGCATALTNFSLPWNTFQALNGTHTVVATAYTSLGATIATSPAITFTNPNTFPISSAPGMTVATSLSGTTLTITPTVTGASATHSKDISYYVDGILLYTDTNAITVSGTGFPLDETVFPDGSHILAILVQDNSGGITTAPPDPSNFYIGYCCEWSATANFSSGAVISSLVADAHEVFLPVAGTHQLVPVVSNADGSVVSSPTLTYYSENNSIATVSAGGLETAIATGAARSPSSARIDIMAQNASISGTDLDCINPCSNGSYKSIAHPFKPQSINQLITLTSSNGWTAGTYLITSAGPGVGAIGLSTCTNGTCVSVAPSCPVPYSGTTCPSGGKTGTATFTTGPTRQSWVMVTPTATPNPPIYHFGIDGSILSTFTPANSFYPISLFQTNKAVPASVTGVSGADQPYGLNGRGWLGDFLGTGFNVIETSPVVPPNVAQAASEFNYQTSAAAIVTAWTNFTTGTNTRFLLAGDTWVKASGAAFGSAGGQFETTRATIFGSWGATPMVNALLPWVGKALWVEGGDEYSEFGVYPFPGTNGFSSGTQIVALGGVCTVTTTGQQINLNSTGHFIISGSSITGMNSVNPASYLANAASTNPNFTFPCPSVTNNTYNATNNPGDGLIIHPFAANSWLNNATGLLSGSNDFLRYDMYTSIKTQINAVGTGRQNWTFPPLGTAGCSYLYGWGNPDAGMSDYLTKFYSGVATYYLNSRSEIFSLVGNNRAAPTVGMGDNLRQWYGCFSPAAPLSNQNSSVPTNYGFQGYPLTVTSFTGSTLTFSTPHNLPNIIPGISRIRLSGMSTSADNGNYFIISTPTPTTMTLVLGATDFIGHGIGGTLTFFPSGAVYTLNAASAIDASGNLNCGHATSGTGSGGLCGDIFATQGAADSTLIRHRCESFTLSGVGAGTGSFATFNSRSFIYDCANPNVNVLSSNNIYHEIPIGSSISGTASVIADQNFIPGRNWSTQVAQDPDMAHAGQWENMIIGGAMTRLYQAVGNMQAYNPTGGFVGLSQGANNSTFNDVTVQKQQLGPHPHWENYYSAPDWHALGLANLLIHRIEPYILTSHLASPDYGLPWECTARTGAIGQAMICLNVTNAPQTATFSLSAYETGGQNIIQFISNSNAIKLSIISAGTSSATVTVPMGGAIVFLFPITFSTSLARPIITARLADVTNATKIVVRYGHDQYLLDGGNTTVDCTTGTCTLPADRTIGPICYRLIYLDTNGIILRIGDIETI